MASKNSDSGETEEDFSFLNIAKTNPAVIKDKVLQERLEKLQGRVEPPKQEGIEKINAEKFVQERLAKIRGTSEERRRREEVRAELRRLSQESEEKMETFEKSAKRGRTETTSPPERPPTPGEARLGDWMRKIEETIKAQVSEIKNLKATVEALRANIAEIIDSVQISETKTGASVSELRETFDGQLQAATATVEALRANIVEITDSVQISETKTGASVSELRETLDGQLQAAAESTDEKINSKVEVVRADTVRSLVNQAKKIEEIRTGFDQQIREAVNQVVKEKLEVSDKPQPKKSAENGIFFTGLDVIAKREKWQGDITEVVHNILIKVGSAPYYTDVIAVHPRNSPRNSAKNAIIYFQSVYHKNYAAARIRMMLFGEKYVRTGIRDLFEPADVPKSKDLTARGFELKKRDVISKFRISNLKGTPIMLIAKRGGAYEKVTDVQVEEMLRRSTQFS